MIVVNDVGRRDIGFDAPENEVLILAPGRPAERMARAGKRAVAERIWDAFVRLRRQAPDLSASTVHLSDSQPK
jgi:hypothetical protein